MTDKIKLFEQKQVRTHWDAENEEWYFSVIDIVEVLTESPSPRKYWSVLKTRLKKEGSELATNCSQLKMQSTDGKYYKTDCMTTKNILRLVQSIPSPKAEPFKMWLAEVGNERLNEIADPEKAILRGAEYYRAKGYTEGWINQRLQSIEMRKELTDEWKARGIEEERDYAILTNEMTVANEGGKTAKTARTNLEKQIGQSVISPLNASDKPPLEIQSDYELLDEQDTSKNNDAQ